MGDVLEEISHEPVSKETDRLPFQERGTARAKKQRCVLGELCSVLVRWLIQSK